MPRRTYEASTGTTHLVNRYEDRPTDDCVLAITECGQTYEVTRIDQGTDIEDNELCGNCL